MGKFGYTVRCALFATVGSLIYGYDSGIISTTLGQETFPKYFGFPSPSLTGAIVSTYSGGQGIGNLVGGWLGDYIGRKKTIWLASTLALIGAMLQTAAVNIGMFLAGRILAGFAIGLVYAVSSIYNAGRSSKTLSPGLLELILYRDRTTKDQRDNSGLTNTDDLHRVRVKQLDGPLW